MMCEPCSPLGDAFQLAAPEALAISGVGPSPGFPRSRLKGSVEELVFTFQGPGDPSNTDLATATRTGDTWSPAGPVTGSGVNTGAAEWAPLPLPEGVEVPGIGLAGSLLFSGFNADQQQIFVASLDGSSRLPVPQVIDPVKDTHSLAFSHAAAAPRYWYMRRVGVADALRFVTQPADGISAHQQLTPPALPGACMVNLMVTLDMAPWATPDGEYLLFHADYPAGCGTPGLRRGFYVQVASDGVPMGEAKELPIDALPADAPVLTPSFSQDLCTLYFASDYEGEPTLYAARRR
jgi:hypothetical protein